MEIAILLGMLFAIGLFVTACVVIAQGEMPVENPRVMEEHKRITDLHNRISKYNRHQQGRIYSLMHEFNCANVDLDIPKCEFRDVKFTEQDAINRVLIEDIAACMETWYDINSRYVPDAIKNSDCYKKMAQASAQHWLSGSNDDLHRFYILISDAIHVLQGGLSRCNEELAERQKREFEMFVNSQQPTSND